MVWTDLQAARFFDEAVADGHDQLQALRHKARCPSLSDYDGDGDGLLALHEDEGPDSFYESEW